MTSHRGGLWTTALPEGGSVWQIFTLEQLKSHSWNIAKETAHPSVGRSLSAGHHRLILPLYRLRQRTATRPPTPLQRHYASKGQSPIYRTVNRLELFIRLPSLLCSPSKWLTITTCKAGVAYSIHPLQTVLGSLPTTQDT